MEIISLSNPIQETHRGDKIIRIHIITLSSVSYARDHTWLESVRIGLPSMPFSPL